MVDEDGSGILGLRPSDKLRHLEVIANEAFNTYRSLYYEGGVSSVYVWDVITDGDPSCKSCFAAAILIKKETEGEADDDSSLLRNGSWDSTHIIEVEVIERKASYKLTTTVMLHLDTVVPKLDSFLLSGSVTRQTEQVITLLTSDNDEEHVANMGRLVEDMESRMRSSLQEIYFGKTHDVVNEIRPVVPAGFLRHQADLQREIAGRLSGLGPRLIPPVGIPSRSIPPSTND